MASTSRTDPQESLDAAEQDGFAVGRDTRGTQLGFVAALWRYTAWTNPKNEAVGVDLYDGRSDPRENVNVAGESAYEATVSEMAKVLKAGWPAQVPG